MPSRLIVLFTDFGGDDIYVAQLKAVLHANARESIVLDLLHSASNFAIEPSAHLLAALAPQFPVGTVFVAVVDPGVGTERDVVVVEADGRWYVGPDNGLLGVVGARASTRRLWRIEWRPTRASASFHGRDVFAPVAAAIARGALPDDQLQAIDRLQVHCDAEDLAEVIYVDHYGNLMTGLRASTVPADAAIAIGRIVMRHARVFGDVPNGALFWYENSIGLVEIAANRASAAERLGARIGDKVVVQR